MMCRDCGGDMVFHRGYPATPEAPEEPACFECQCGCAINISASDLEQLSLDVSGNDQDGPDEGMGK